MVLNEWLVKRQMSKEGLARRAGVGISTIRRLADGARATFRVAQAVSRATDGEVKVLTLVAGGDRSAERVVEGRAS